ncbi:Holliday junction DNA helicase RuvA [Paenibacillus shirakamiensis]|uniref:Holliday junction branch migration complex subunit RuvA n=1 Tax=Paenibacillus shirakamiensis TaxID=1265935 RepID=A0ABS4JBA8_9BACL|nr:Holliday junction branch migration protein RuvA [Paenibacillus shirakamiensis]MBP1998994.1 Holliday junction DNA helicase RuvA [Paenibacillus shirakamiensis]
MIDYLHGQVVHYESDYIVMDVQHIGYRVFCPNPFVFAKSENSVTVYIHYNVREDAILLYGFATREEQKLFRKLIEVTGIGPRVALGILAGGTPDQVVAAIYQENITFLTKLPGIGKKTAQRIILDLKDKLDGIAVMPVLVPVEGEHDLFNPIFSGWKEAREGLKALGYTDGELDKVWHSLKDGIAPEESVDSVMKKALRMLYAG